MELEVLHERRSPREVDLAKILFSEVVEGSKRTSDRVRLCKGGFTLFVWKLTIAVQRLDELLRSEKPAFQTSFERKHRMEELDI